MLHLILADFVVLSSVLTFSTNTRSMGTIKGIKMRYNVCNRAGNDLRHDFFQTWHKAGQLKCLARKIMFALWCHYFRLLLEGEGTQLLNLLHIIVRLGKKFVLAEHFVNEQKEIANKQKCILHSHNQLAEMITWPRPHRHQTIVFDLRLFASHKRPHEIYSRRVAPLITSFAHNFFSHSTPARLGQRRECVMQWRNNQMNAQMALEKPLARAMSRSSRFCSMRAAHRGQLFVRMTNHKIWQPWKGEISFPCS